MERLSWLDALVFILLVLATGAGAYYLSLHFPFLRTTLGSLLTLISLSVLAVCFLVCYIVVKLEIVEQGS